MGGNELEAIKTTWEAFKSDVKTRLGIAIGFSSFLLCRTYIETLPSGKELFSVLAVPSFFICIIFWISIILDIIFKLIKNLNDKIKWHHYDKYILSLKGRRREIVKQIYHANDQHKMYLNHNDTDVIELEMKGIIVCPKYSTILGAEVWPEDGDLNDPPFLYVLQPAALRLIEKHKKKFKLDKK